jgi:hypothetical protein
MEKESVTGLRPLEARQDETAAGSVVTEAGAVRAVHIISLGAGVQSSTMALMAAHGLIDPMPDCAIFADTGWEPKKVYEWLDWLETKLPFPVYRVSAGSLRDNLVTNTTGQRFAAVPWFMPGSDGREVMGRRQCTSEYKIQPIRKKVRELLGLKKGERGGKNVRVVQWIGISTDEIQRMKESQDKYIKHRWPLIEMRMNRNDCLKWMERTQYPKPAKSSCIGCPYHSNSQWRDLRDNSPDEWADAVEVDRIIRNGTPQQQSKSTPLNKQQFMHRDLRPLDQVDLSTPEERGQYSFLDECEGMCGV